MILLQLTTQTNEPMHWALAGLIIGLVVPALLLYGNKSFGVSSSLRHLCTIGLKEKKRYFSYDLKSHYWSLFFVFGISIGGFVAHIYNPNTNIIVGHKTEIYLNDLDIENKGGLYPTDIYTLHNPKGLLLLILGGLLIGFGTRYANGCTSGHSIFGLANFQLSSLIATISFFIGGMIMTYFILPSILQS